MAGCKWLQMQKSDLYQDRLLKFMTRWDKCIM